MRASRLLREPWNIRQRCSDRCFWRRRPRPRRKRAARCGSITTTIRPATSLLEESTIASVTPFAAVFNNLVVFDPAKAHESLETVIPDLAESWSWDATNTKLTFKLRQGVNWHDGKPFTAKDVQCTWRMLIGKGDNARLPPQPAQGLVLETARTSRSTAITRRPSS